jgi:SUMO ligase MMS21 Smc5/6 complex component
MPESVLEVIVTYIGGICLWVLEMGFAGKCIEILNLFASPSQNSENIELIEEIDIENDTICAICLDSIIRGIALPSCNHIFHKDCILGWLRQASTCPYCRSTI